MFQSRTRIRIKLTLGILMFFLTIAGAFYCTSVINELADGMKDGRREEAAWFAKLVRDNWDGIKSVSDQRKKQLLKNLDPRLAGTDIDLMRFQSLVLAYALFAICVLAVLAGLVRDWKKLRSGTSVV